MDNNWQDKRVLVTGGSGLVGTALKSIIPNWSYVSSSDYNLTEQSSVRQMFKEIKPEAVIHLAARVGGIKANLSYPAEFFYENVIMNTLVVEEAYRSGTRRLLACLSTCAFPDIVPNYPYNADALHLGPPAPSNLAYGYAKRVLEVQIGAYRKQYGLDYITVSPCNLYGPGDNFNPEESHLVPALIVKCLKAKNNNESEIELWGTGKPLRQQLFSIDFAKILVQLLNEYNGDLTVLAAHPENKSILQIATTVANVVGYKGQLKFNGKMDGQFRKDACTSFFESIIPDFEFTPLESGVRQTIEWYCNAITQKQGEQSFVQH